MECTIGRVVHGGGELQKPLESSKTSVRVLCDVIICVREDAVYKENIVIKLQGFGLDKKDLFGKSDPYIVLEKKNEKGRWTRSYRSEVVKNTLNPDWRPILVSIDRLCNGNIDDPIYFRCYDWDGANGDPEDKDTEFDDLIGEFPATVREILDPKKSELRFELINPKKKRKKKGYSHSGLVTLRSYRSGKDFSFLDYMFGGTNLNFTVAVDLSASNGDIRSTHSLHYFDLNSPNENEYSVAIQAVLEIIQEYDSDELFPAYGFGARVPTAFNVCHEYPLNGDYQNPFCKGMDGVLRAYQKALQEVKLSNPSFFAPIIRNVANMSKDYQDGSHYFVLLILTNGTVDDWQETKKAVIEASHLPMSIIVIGIGGGKFSAMEILDQDFGLLKMGQDQACRDNVQFVQMRKFLRMAADGTDHIKWSKVALAKEVLAELPEQLMEYMRRRGLKPKDVDMSATGITNSSDGASANSH